MGEPFTTVLVQLADGMPPAMAPVHYSCTLATIAGEAAAAVVEASEGGASVRLEARGHREADPLRSKLHTLFSDMLDDVMEG